MKAIVQNKYGSADVLELREIDEVVAADDQMLVRVRAASVHADVWHVMQTAAAAISCHGSACSSTSRFGTLDQSRSRGSSISLRACQDSGVEAGAPGLARSE